MLVMPRQGSRPYRQARDLLCDRPNGRLAQVMLGFKEPRQRLFTISTPKFSAQANAQGLAIRLKPAITSQRVEQRGHGHEPGFRQLQGRADGAYLMDPTDHQWGTTVPR